MQKICSLKVFSHVRHEAEIKPFEANKNEVI
jgi:hypothetical protein